MSWLKTIGGFLFGGSSGGNVGKVAEVVDDAIHTEQERTETDQKDLSEARGMLSTACNGFVDGVNRCIRPGVTVWLIGGMSGWWKLPAPGEVDDFWLNTFYLVLTFWFGGRAILKDLPAAIKAIRGR